MLFKMDIKKVKPNNKENNMRESNQLEIQRSSRRSELWSSNLARKIMNLIIGSVVIRMNHHLSSRKENIKSFIDIVALVPVITIQGKGAKEELCRIVLSFITTIQNPNQEGILVSVKRETFQALTKEGSIEVVQVRGAKRRR